MPIRRLSVQLANQIAAGEVVERPASVVKELLENAIDAHASSITLEIKNAGKMLIKVTDNGVGIPHDELTLALAPHATSKISCLEDLSAIMTLGFRGEALASIASVSKLTLISKTKDEEHGYQVEVSGPEQNPQVAPAAHPVGSSVIVRELFFNTPARRRFLKSDKTEFNHIKELITKLALVNYSIEFKFVSDGKVVLHVPANSKEELPQRIAKLLGSEFRRDVMSFDSASEAFSQAQQRLQEMEAQDIQYGHFQYQRAQELASITSGYGNYQLDLSDKTEAVAGAGAGAGVDTGAGAGAANATNKQVLHIHGVLLKPPALTQAIPDKLLTFLNGRCIYDRTVNHALREGYIDALKGTVDFKPSLRGVIFMECDPHIVDVNVHPRKDEVRFHNSNLIHDCIVNSIKTVLTQYGLSAHNVTMGALPIDESDLGADSSNELLSGSSSTNPQKPLQQQEPNAETVTVTVTETENDKSSDRNALYNAALASALEDAPSPFPLPPIMDKLPADFGKPSSSSRSSFSSNSEQLSPEELRERVEEYFAQHPTAVHDSALPDDQQSLKAKICDFSALKLGEDERKAQQAAKLATTKAPVESEEIETTEHAADTEDSVSIAMTVEKTDASAAAEKPTSTPSMFSLGKQRPKSSLEQLLQEQERERRQQKYQAQGVEAKEQDDEGSAPKTSVSEPDSPANASDQAPAVLPSALHAIQQQQEQVSSMFEKPRFFNEVMADLPDGAGAVLDGASVASANFLSLVQPDVLLFTVGNRYFLARGSELFTACLALEFSHQVELDQVITHEMTVPFSVKCSEGLIKAYKRADVKSAAARAGFVVQPRAARAVIELIAIPKLITGCNLAQVAIKALQLIAAGTDSLNEGHCMQQLALLIARAKGYEINTEYDAKRLVGKLMDVDQFVKQQLIRSEALRELRIMDLAQQLLGLPLVGER